MQSVNLFYNNRLYIRERPNCKPPSLPVLFCTRIGDACFDPVRVLFKGTCSTVYDHVNYGPSVINVKDDFGSRDWLSIAVAIAFFVPGLILGTVFKGLAFLSQDVRAAQAKVLAFHDEEALQVKQWEN